MVRVRSLNFYHMAISVMHSFIRSIQYAQASLLYTLFKIVSDCCDVICLLHGTKCWVRFSYNHVRLIFPAPSGPLSLSTTKLPSYLPRK